MRYATNLGPRRRGFTLIELLVVMAIIAVLAALTAAGVFRLVQSQSLKRTEVSVKKLHVAFEQQWHAVIDDVKNEINNGKVPLAVLNLASPTTDLAGGDRDRGNAIYLKLRLIQEFPMTFQQASSNMLGAKSYYAQELAGWNGQGSVDDQNAALLYLIVTEGRRGAAAFNPDDAGAGSVQTRQIGNKSMRVFVDAYGTPIVFERWTTNTAILTELNSAPYAPSTGVNRDLHDPLGKLRGTSWGRKGAAQTAVGHVFDGQNRSPFIRAAAQDKTYRGNDDILSFRLMKEGQRGN